MPASLSSEGDPMTDTAPPDVNALARGYGRTVYLAAWRVLGDAGQAEDVQQDVFLRLLETPPGDVASWPAYLAAMATRQAIDRLRSRQRWRRHLIPAVCLRQRGSGRAEGGAVASRFGGHAGAA